MTQYLPRFLVILIRSGKFFPAIEDFEPIRWANKSSFTALLAFEKEDLGIIKTLPGFRVLDFKASVFSYNGSDWKMLFRDWDIDIESAAQKSGILSFALDGIAWVLVSSSNPLKLYPIKISITATMSPRKTFLTLNLFGINNQCIDFALMIPDINPMSASSSSSAIVSKYGTYWGKNVIKLEFFLGH